jgi:hypothetical protein
VRCSLEPKDTIDRIRSQEASSVWSVVITTCSTRKINSRKKAWLELKAIVLKKTIAAFG